MALLSAFCYSFFMAEHNPDIIDPVEDCPWRTPREIFERYGYSPLPPAGFSFGKPTT